MVFGIACVVITPLAARRSDRLERPRVFIIIGGLIVGLGCLLPTLSETTAGVLGAVAVIGSGYAILNTPQLASIQKIAERGREYGVGPGVIVGSFRTLERIGTAAGAVVVGAVVTFVGYSEAMLAVAALVVVCTIAYALLGMQGDEGEAAA